MKSFLAKFFHWGTPRAPQNLKKSHFSEFKIFEKQQFLASNPLETMNIDMWNHFGGVEITLPPSDPPKTYFFENFQISVYFQVSSKSRFFRGLKGGSWTPNQ